jgi:predicted oxidoreductase (fatty acid repression mutant protein)
MSGMPYEKATRAGGQVVIHGSSKMVVETLRETYHKAKANAAKLAWQESGANILACKAALERMKCAAAIGEYSITLESPLPKPVAMQLRYTAGLIVSDDGLTISLF